MWTLLVWGFFALWGVSTVFSAITSISEKRAYAAKMKEARADYARHEAAVEAAGGQEGFYHYRYNPADHPNFTTPVAAILSHGGAGLSGNSLAPAQD